MTDTPSATFDARTLADRLYSLRADGQTKPTAEFALPENIAAAMQAQKALSARENAPDTAWKVAMSPDKIAVIAPLHPYVETSDEAELPYLPEMKFEVEIAVRLSRDVPVRNHAYSRADIFDAVGSAYLGAELLSSAIAESGKVSFPLYVADRIGNRGYALGPVVPKTFIDSVASADLVVVQDGTELYNGLAKHPVDDVLAWLVAYANDTTRPENALTSGTVITTGALSGAMSLRGSGPVEVLFAGEYKIVVTLTSGD